MKKTAIIVILIVLYYHVDAYLRVINAEEIAIETCVSKLGKNKCSIDAINQKIRKPNQIMNTDGEFINGYSGKVEAPDLTVLSTVEKNIFYNNRRRLIADKSSIGTIYTRIKDYRGEVMSYIVVAIISLLMIAVIFFLTPFLWRWFLARVRELSDAIKGSK